MYGSGIKEVNIDYQSGKENVARSPTTESQEAKESELHVAAVQSSTPPDNSHTVADKLPNLQRADPWAKAMMDYLEDGILPSVESSALRIIAQSKNFTVCDGVLYLWREKGRSEKFSQSS